MVIRQFQQNNNRQFDEFLVNKVGKSLLQDNLHVCYYCKHLLHRHRKYVFPGDCLVEQSLLVGRKSNIYDIS